MPHSICRRHTPIISSPRHLCLTRRRAPIGSDSKGRHWRQPIRQQGQRKLQHVACFFYTLLDLKRRFANEGRWSTISKLQRLILQLLQQSPLASLHRLYPILITCTDCQSKYSDFSSAQWRSTLASRRDLKAAAEKGERNVQLCEI